MKRYLVVLFLVACSKTPSPCAEEEADVAQTRQEAKELQEQVNEQKAMVGDGSQLRDARAAFNQKMLDLKWSKSVLDECQRKQTR